MATEIVEPIVMIPRSFVVVEDPRVVESRRRRKEAEKKRRRDVDQAKKQGDKEPLDVERFVRAMDSSGDEAKIKRISSDPMVIEDLEEKYYLEAPREIKTTINFIRWVSELERQGGS